MGLVEDLQWAREAFERREWLAAYEGLSDRDASALTAEDFTQLATAAYLVGRSNDAIQALQRAYQVSIDAGETLAAVRCGLWLAFLLVEGGEPAVGGGWVGRCQHLLDDLGEDVVERGYLLVHVMMGHVFAAEFDRVEVLAVEIGGYGRRFGDANLVAQSLNARGRMLLYQGRVPEGLALLDEAMIGITTGEVSPVWAGMVYCSLIEACQEVSDYGRAAQWTAVLTTFVDEQPDLVAFTGQAAVHRGQLMRLRGAYTEAVEEFGRAVRRYAGSRTPWAAGLAWAECGEVLRIRGEYTAAEDAYRQAVEFGYEPQPGLAQLWMARGRVTAAVAAVRRLLTEPRDPVHRSRLLPGAVEVLLSAGAVEDAETLSEELTAMATTFGIPAIRALACFARGGVLAGRGEHSAAIAELRRAMHEWHGLDIPYEVARCRFLIGKAMLDLDDAESAATELDTACRTFRELGAVPAEQAVLAARGAPSAPGGLTRREVDVLRLVASGSSTPEIARALVLSQKTVERHLANIYTKLGVSSRTAAARFAFDHDLV
ncbi:response regulator transcription factor [Actinophytocola sp.]|uniref:response regulator transcription factor n=1 Tax=Actinophytocola sp. TaxID=1872138 RepID=UPI002ED479BD